MTPRPDRTTAEAHRPAGDVRPAGTLGLSAVPPRPGGAFSSSLGLPPAFFRSLRAIRFVAEVVCLLVLLSAYAVLPALVAVALGVG